jgi:hypothetical protein
MQKPTGITVTTVLMVLFLISGAVLTFGRPMPAVPNSPVSSSAIAAFAHIGFAVYAVIALVCIWFYYSGKEWARWVIMIVSVLELLSLISIAKTFATSHAVGANAIAQALLAAFLLYYLNTEPIRAWFSREEPTAV